MGDGPRGPPPRMPPPRGPPPRGPPPGAGAGPPPSTCACQPNTSFTDIRVGGRWIGPLRHFHRPRFYVLPFPPSPSQGDRRQAPGQGHRRARGHAARRHVCRRESRPPGGRRAGARPRGHPPECRRGDPLQGRRPPGDPRGGGRRPAPRQECRRGDPPGHPEGRRPGGHRRQGDR